MMLYNRPADLKIKNLSNMTVTFLLPNVTPALQLLDKGIIQTFKALYRKFLITYVVAISNNLQSINELVHTLLMCGMKLILNQSLNALPVQVLRLTVLDHTNKKT